MSEKKENTVMGMETTAVPVESANTTVMQKEAAAAGQPHPKIEVELSPHDDFVLDIAVGKNRNQKNWKPYKITFKQLKERLAKTVYTDETMAQYATFSRTKQGEIKDVGGMVMAVLKGGHRGKQDVLSRSAITLDIDYGVPGIEDVLDFTTDFAGIIYSTHKHKPEAPRLRLVIPLSRSVMAEEYVAIARKVAEEIDIEMFDDTTYEPNRLMYWPSTSKDGVYVYRELHGDLLNPDSVLARYKNWHDVSEYPVSSRQTKIVQHMMQKQKDPLTKNNLIGAFCQAYDIPSAIGSFLNEVYEPTASPDRYSYIPADSVAGVVVYENKGEQGCGKSTLIRRMGGNWYNDSLQLNDTKDKTAAEKLQGYWIMEIGELAGLRKADTEILKGFLSRQDDIFRAAFGRRATPHPRQCVFIGTTNAENGYLRDVTGNRRFWPVNTPGFKEEDRVRGCRPSWELSDEEVKQIWAEALYRYEQGEKLYLEGDIGIEAIHQQKMSMETDDREPMVREYLDKLLPANWDSLTLFQRRDYIQGTEFSNDGVSTLPGTVKRTVVCNQEIWCECFGRDRGSIGRQDSNSIIAMMERIDGWKRSPKKQRVKGYGIVNVYVRDAGDEE